VDPVAKFIIIPRCDDHNGKVEQALITNRALLAPLASAVEPPFDLAKWSAELGEWYRQCPAS
jgi:hypothetical protein